MKKINILVFLFLIAFVSMAQNKADKSFVIHSNIKGLPDSKVIIMMSKQGEEPKVIDSAMSKAGVFTLKGKVSIPDVCRIVFTKLNNQLTFFVENSEIHISGHIDSLDQVKYSGSKTQNAFIKVMGEVNVFTRLQKDCETKFKEAQIKNDMETMALYDSISSKVFENQIIFLSKFALENNKTVVSPYIVLTQLIYYIDLKMLDSITNNFDKSIDSSIYVKQLQARVAVLKKTDIGMPAPEIEMADSLGFMFKLSSLKGKYILIDFWASWCGPCRKENPNVVAAYQMFKNKGFDILGVSFDQNGKNWLKAVNDDHLTWHHVSDLKGWGNEAGKIYGINSIPHSVLIDKNGIIVAKNLRGDALINKLKELMP